MAGPTGFDALVGLDSGSKLTQVHTDIDSNLVIVDFLVHTTNRKASQVTILLVGGAYLVAWVKILSRKVR